ncbi:Hypothetical protein SRAE_X000222800 [Strongyloides ratti]|uniref:Uncharacterized protein n=1 Tax=Strongyloides ratti TaxID=34506 RepID=A0A090KZ24_STRRB|nr:Hypothetical protein SRAE_X000222800 [Strongyloides ratti]CEF60489.1 Hypothetical protein SRAE_X000222800 [Strongyloides ratti]
MDSISKGKSRKKNKKTLLRERNRRASLMRNCVKNRIIQNHEPGKELSGRLNLKSDFDTKDESKEKSSLKGNEKLNYKKNKKLIEKKRCRNKVMPMKLIKNDNFEKEDSDVNEIYENHTFVTEQLNIANHILDDISVTLKNMECVVMRRIYRKTDKEQTINHEKRVLRSEKRKMENDIICLKEEILKIKNLLKDVKNENEKNSELVDKLIKKNSYLLASEKYKTELCEDLHDKIAALESNKTVKYYWSQS